MSFTGQKVDFLKLLFGGSGLQLPIKGSHIQKTDNPLIISAANHSLKQLVERKYATGCTCTHERHGLDQVPFCRDLRHNVSAFTSSFYATMAARIYEIRVFEPLVRPDFFDEDLAAYAACASVTYSPLHITPKPKPDLVSLAISCDAPPGLPA